MSYSKHSSFRSNRIFTFVLDHLVQITLIFVVVAAGLVFLNRNAIMGVISSFAPDLVSFSTSSDTVKKTVSPSESSSDSASTSEDKSATAPESTTNSEEPSGDVPAEAGGDLSDVIDSDIANNDSAASQYSSAVATENDNDSTFTATVSEQEANDLSDIDAD